MRRLNTDKCKVMFVTWEKSLTLQKMITENFWSKYKLSSHQKRKFDFGKER